MWFRNIKIVKNKLLKSRWIGRISLILPWLILGVSVLLSGFYYLVRKYLKSEYSHETRGLPVQKLHDGVGPITYRRYTVEIIDLKQSAVELMTDIQCNIDHYAPELLAYFEKTEDRDPTKNLRVGEEYFIDIAGPFNGPVRVVDVDKTHFVFITLEGHLEAGEICFRLYEKPGQQDMVVFEIFSYARAGHKMSHLSYNVLGVAKQAQTAMWVSFCERVLEASGGTSETGVRVLTEKAPYVHRYARPETTWEKYEEALESFSTVSINFPEDVVDTDGWFVDRYRAVLPPYVMQVEPNTSWDVAKDVIGDYLFPEPRLVRGYFPPDSPLEDRRIVIEAQFLFFTFLLGLRVNQVIDEERDDDQQGQARVWGFSYQTLEGHFEMGEMWFEVWHFLQTGHVEFRIHARSRRATIKNPFYALGFRVFGRWLQIRFAQQSLSRMQAIVAQRLNDARDEKSVQLPPTGDENSA
jgi:uncharacterized protein (UPF0548 family)